MAVVNVNPYYIYNGIWYDKPVIEAENLPSYSYVSTSSGQKAYPGKPMTKEEDILIYDGGISGYDQTLNNEIEKGKLKNRLIVNGVDLHTQYGMILEDGFVLEPPSPKTYIVDIPGGNGKLDLTESLLGDTAYDNRRQEFTFYNIMEYGFEKFKTNIMNFLHGKEFDYQMTMDEGYTYHGRFTVKSCEHKKYMNGIVATTTIEVDAKPFKMKEDKVYTVDAIGGIIVYLDSGRMRSRPTIEVNSGTKLIYNNKQISLPVGTWTVNDLVLKEGLNKLYINSYEIHNLTWGHLKNENVTWAKFKEKMLFEWYKSKGDKTYFLETWNELKIDGKDINTLHFSDIEDHKWNDFIYGENSDVENVGNTYIKYEWGDL